MSLFAKGSKICSFDGDLFIRSNEDLLLIGVNELIEGCLGAANELIDGCFGAAKALIDGCFGGGGSTNKSMSLLIMFVVFGDVARTGVSPNESNTSGFDGFCWMLTKGSNASVDFCGFEGVCDEEIFSNGSNVSSLGEMGSNELAGAGFGLEMSRNGSNVSVDGDFGVTFSNELIWDGFDATGAGFDVNPENGSNVSLTDG